MNSAWVKHAISEINADYQRSADTHLIRLPLPAEPIVRSRLKVGHEIMDNWAKHFPKAYDNELQHSINHLRSIEPTAGPGNKDGFAACCIADAMIASQTSEKVETVNFEM